MRKIYKPFSFHQDKKKTATEISIQPEALKEIPVTSPVHKNKFTGTIFSANDTAGKNFSSRRIILRDKKAIEDSLHHSQHNFHSLTENLPNIFFSIDKNCRFIHWNNACFQITGLKADVVVGRTVAEAFPEYADSYLINRAKEILITKKADSFDVTFDLYEKRRAFHVIAFPSASGISILMNDITEKKKAETETAALIQRLQQRNKELKQFAYIVSHNLRSPIAKVKGMGLLINYNKKTNQKKAFSPSLLKIILSEVDSLDEMLRDLNMLTAVHDISGANEYVDFSEKLNLVRIILEKEIDKHNVLIHENLKHLPGIISVPDYVYSILFHLISNSIKYRAHHRRLQISIDALEDKKYYQLHISDNGMGMDLKKNQTKVFGLYKRFHNHVDGRGVGLHLVRNQVEALLGKIEVESEVDLGTTFRIFFPKPDNL